jgi:hypothetical protein
MRALALLALVLAPSIPRPSGACSVDAGHGGDHRLDPEHATDMTASGAVTADFDLYFDPDDESPGCSSCGGDYSHIRFGVAASDDRTPADRLAYKFAISGGRPPNGIDLPFKPLFIGYDGGVQLRISRENRELGFEIEIRAVDLNGNVGPPTLLTVRKPA